MLVKQPKRINTLKWMGYVLGFEIAVIGVSYFIWNRMNTNQNFRLYMYKNFPTVLEGFYSLGKFNRPQYNLEKIDKQFWIENGDLTTEKIN